MSDPVIASAPKDGVLLVRNSQIRFEGSMDELVADEVKRKYLML